MIEEIRRWLLIVFWAIIWLHLFCVAKFKRISKHLSFLFNQIQQVTHNFPLSFKIASQINTHEMNSIRSPKKGEVEIPPRTHWWALSLRKRRTSPFTFSYTLSSTTLWPKTESTTAERSSSGLCSAGRWLAGDLTPPPRFFLLIFAFAALCRDSLKFVAAWSWSCVGGCLFMLVWLKTMRWLSERTRVGLGWRNRTNEIDGVLWFCRFLVKVICW